MSTPQRPEREVFDRAFQKWRTQQVRRPTIGEYSVYDEHLYRWMMEDAVRTAAFRNAIAAAVPGKTVLDLGTGSEAFLAVMCAAAGAAHVDALEAIPESAAAARRHVAGLGLSNVVTVHCGQSTNITLSERVDICVSETIGMIGGGEGASRVLLDARRFLRNDGRMIPQRCITWFAPAANCTHYYSDPDVEAVTRFYVEAIYSTVGRRFPFTRMATFNFPRENLLANPRAFEVLDFNSKELPDQSREAQFVATRTGVCSGFSLWLEIDVDDQNHINTWSGTSWAPVFLETAPFEYRAGDLLNVVCTSTPSANGINPDYQIRGTAVRGSSPYKTFLLKSPYIGEND